PVSPSGRGFFEPRFEQDFSRTCVRTDSPGAKSGLSVNGGGRTIGLLRAEISAASRSEPLTMPPTVHEALRSPGRPLDTPTRAFMQSRFGHDFTHVLVHTDASAAHATRALNALAYASGRHIVFAAGHYVPATIAGRRLLAHELAHVVQQ